MEHSRFIDGYFFWILMLFDNAVLKVQKYFFSFFSTAEPRTDATHRGTWRSFLMKFKRKCTSRILLFVSYSNYSFNWPLRTVCKPASGIVFNTALFGQRLASWEVSRQNGASTGDAHTCGANLGLWANSNHYHQTEEMRLGSGWLLLMRSKRIKFCCRVKLFECIFVCDHIDQ